LDLANTVVSGTDMNIGKALMKKYESMSLKDIAASPVTAIAGITESDATQLNAAFGVKTVTDLANLKYVKWAQAIVTLAETEE
jgi:hypothetical protein